MNIDDWIKQRNAELERQIAEVKEDLRVTQHRIDTIWWKVAVVATLCTIAVGKLCSWAWWLWS